MRQKRVNSTPSLQILAKLFGLSGGQCDMQSFQGWSLELLSYHQFSLLDCTEILQKTNFRFADIPKKKGIPQIKSIETLVWGLLFGQALICFSMSKKRSKAVDSLTISCLLAIKQWCSCWQVLQTRLSRQCNIREQNNTPNLSKLIWSLWCAVRYAKFPRLVT